MMKNHVGGGVSPPKSSNLKGERKEDYSSNAKRVIELPFLFRPVRLENPCRYTTFVVTTAWFMQSCVLSYTSILLLLS